MKVPVDMKSWMLQQLDDFYIGPREQNVTPSFNLHNAWDLGGRIGLSMDASKMDAIETKIFSRSGFTLGGSLLRFKDRTTSKSVDKTAISDVRHFNFDRTSKDQLGQFENSLFGQYLLLPYFSRQTISTLKIRIPAHAKFDSQLSGHAFGPLLPKSSLSRIA